MTEDITCRIHHNGMQNDFALPSLDPTTTNMSGMQLMRAYQQQ